MLEDRGYRINCILANVGVTMLEASPGGGQQGLDEFRLTKLA